MEVTEVCRKTYLLLPTLMPNQISLSQIVDNLSQLSFKLEPKEFIYDFLSCFGLPKATIARLKGHGGVNLAKKKGCTLLKSKVYFEPIHAELLDALTPLRAIELAQKDSRVVANKPRFIISTDFKMVAALDTKQRETIQFPISDLHEHYAFFLPLAGMEKSTVHTEAEADVKAAENMAKLYDLIRADNPPKTREDRHALNVFLTRLLFCYFAEDTKIFSDKSFTRAVESFTQADGSDLKEFLQDLFLILNTDIKDRRKAPKHLAEFPYVNGGLFSDTHTRRSIVPEFSAKSRQRLIDLGTKSWKEINPDIFGSMFQGVVDDEERAELGMHYTSVPNIMKVLKPLFLDELYEELEKSKGSEPKLKRLLARIYRLRFFDPACGSGNFLIIAYKEVRRLEMAVFKEFDKVDKHSALSDPQGDFSGAGFRPAIDQPSLTLGQAVLRLPGIHVSQFYGIELDDFAHEIAVLALWLAEHQMNLEFKTEFGNAPASLPLKDGAHIKCDNALRSDWSDLCRIEEEGEVFVLGNPPYQGARRQSPEQKMDMALVAGHIDAHLNLDYIGAFFLKATSYIQGTAAKVGFVTTNSICQGEQVAILWPQVFGKHVEIGFVHQSFNWSNSAKGNAGVTCVIIGLRSRSQDLKWIYGANVRRKASNISPYLVEGGDTVVVSRREPLSQVPPITFGNMPNDRGYLLLDRSEQTSLIETFPEAKKFVRRLMGTEEFIDHKERWCLWITPDHLEEALKIPEIENRINLVADERRKSDRESTKRLASRPQEFGEIRHEDGPAILIPIHTGDRREYIPIGFLSSGQIIHNSAFAVYRAEPWLFGLLSSKMHIVWVKAVAGRIREDTRYSAAICYNCFPFPVLDARQRDLLARCVEKVLIEREKSPSKTIGQLYDPDLMPEGLLMAHRALDEVVDSSYRKKPFTTVEERLELLFALYQEKAASKGAELFATKPAKGTKSKAEKGSSHA